MGLSSSSLRELLQKGRNAVRDYAWTSSRVTRVGVQWVKLFLVTRKLLRLRLHRLFVAQKHHNRLFGEDPLYVEKLAAAERGNSWQYDDNAKNTVLLNEETEEKRTSVLNVLDDLMHAEVIDEVTAALEAARNKGGKTSSRSSTEATNELQAHNSALKHEFQKPFPIDQPGPFADTPT